MGFFEIVKYISLKLSSMETNTEGLGDIKMEEFEELKGLSILRGGGTERGWNGIKYKQGLSGKNVGSKNCQ